MEEKRQLVSFVFQNLELDGRKLLFKTKTPFERVLEYQGTHDWGAIVEDVRTVFERNDDVSIHIPIF